MNKKHWWIAAILIFGIIDLVTTFIGLQLGAVESNSFPALLLAQFGFIALIIMKILAFGVFRLFDSIQYWLYTTFFSQQPYWKAISAKIVPVSLTVMGVIIAINNLSIIAIKTGIF